MIIRIEDREFESSEITRLYPAVVVKTGYKDETTQMSLEWLDVEAQGRVEVVGYGIFIHLGEKRKESFVYKSREEMDEAIGSLAAQLRE